LLKSVDANGTLWGALVVPQSGDGAKLFGANADAPRSAYVSLNLAKTLELKLGLLFTDDSRAKDNADKLTHKIDEAKSDAMLAPFATAAKVSTTGKATLVNAALDDKQMDQLLALIDQQFGAMLPTLLGPSSEP